MQYTDGDERYQRMDICRCQVSVSDRNLHKGPLHGCCHLLRVGAVDLEWDDYDEVWFSAMWEREREGVVDDWVPLLLKPR